ncbi:MAG: tRNA lysidine(34) synthetase TilS [Ahrensia sp.]|nr:tRNA lysidine(34) synthetase TilS [Ahrensia sp.]
MILPSAQARRVSAHAKIVVAVSGGGDSMAMLHLLVAAKRDGRIASDICVATVDHGLRDGSAQEAKFVASWSQEFGLCHQTLKWSPRLQASSQAARLARYELLARHAIDIGATAILLGHTVNDQAETVLMRAQRMVGDSATRGLSAIPPLAHYSVAPGERVTLLRPLLTVHREALRSMLKEAGLPWIDEPSNEDLRFERIRARAALRADPDLPGPQHIAELAALAQRSRHWLNAQAESALDLHLRVSNEGKLHLERAHLPRVVSEQVFACLICVVGGGEHWPAPSKLHDLVEAYGDGLPLRRNLGRALVTIDASGARFERESRNLPKVEDQESGPFDGRFFIHQDGTMRPFILALERFCPESDHALRDAVCRKLCQRFEPAQNQE